MARRNLTDIHTDSIEDETGGPDNHQVTLSFEDTTKDLSLSVDVLTITLDGYDKTEVIEQAKVVIRALQPDDEDYSLNEQYLEDWRTS